MHAAAGTGGSALVVVAVGLSGGTDKAGLDSNGSQGSAKVWRGLKLRSNDGIWRKCD